MLLRQNGASVQQASMAFAYLNIGAIVSSVVVGRLMDRFNPFRLLAGTFFLAFVTVGIFGMLVKGSFTVLAIEAVITGLFIFGSTGGLLALATISHPVSIRGSGVGWAYAIGKVGSMLGPVVGGILLSLHWGVGRICWVAGTSALLCTITLMILRAHAAAAASGASPQPVSAAAAVNSSK
jgi:AAHS family 4-hydroxybenzoate transporter-like MFS transporter